MRTASKAFYLAVFSLLSNAHPDSKPATRSKGFHSDVCGFEPKDTVSDACVSYSTLDSLNTQLTPALKSITQTTDFFAYYRLNLFNRVCPFWSDENGMCGNIACAVETLDNEEDIPEIWRAEELGKLEGPKAEHPGRREQAANPEKPLHGGLGEDVGESCVVEYDDECDERDYCVPDDERASARGDYVSLVDNPERFTGYAGPGAQQVWNAIYQENCFSKQPAAGSSQLSKPTPFGGQASVDLKSVMKDYNRQQAIAKSTDSISGVELDDECLEKRVFYRVISGMHASISSHLCWDYLNQTTGAWGPNLACYKSRLHEHPERLSNLYFNYALLLRAVAKLRPLFSIYTFCSGDTSQDALTKQKVLALADSVASGPSIFDESLMFQDAAATGLKEDFRNRFRNVSRLMDCVGCDKCRLWGKLQTAGYGAALKVLFEYDDSMSALDSAYPPLRRTEIVALVNTLDRVSTSLKAVADFRNMLDGKTLGAPASSGEEVDDEETEPEVELTLSEIFWDEFDRVYAAFRQVLRSWMDAPGIVWRIAIQELSRLWDWWLGIPTAPRTWKWQVRRWSADEL